MRRAAKRLSESLAGQAPNSFSNATRVWILFGRELLLLRDRRASGGTVCREVLDRQVRHVCHHRLVRDDS